MSLLRHKDSVLSYEDDSDEPQSAGWSKLSDGLDGIDGHDDFADDADADNLSLDGIYDDDPPVYRAEPSVADVDSSPDSLPRHFNALSITSTPNTDGISNRNRQQPYYPGIDFCIVGSKLCLSILYIELGQ